MEALLGSTYLVLYFLAVLVVPMLLVAAPLSAFLTRWVATHGPESGSKQD